MWSLLQDQGLEAIHEQDPPFPCLLLLLSRFFNGMVCMENNYPGFPELVGSLRGMEGLMMRSALHL